MPARTFRICDRESPNYNKRPVCYTREPHVPPEPQTKAQSGQEDPGRIPRLGAWLFKHRTSIPLPIAVGLLLIPPSAFCRSCPSGPSRIFGALIVVLGELLRLWGVRHIGVISRTRSDRVGPLVETGPFAMVRNPLYLGNILLWIGFTVSAGLLGLVPVVAAVLALAYHAIVRWEERLVESKVGASYRAYVDRVPRWVPRLTGAPRGSSPSRALFSWRETLYSERGTLMAIAAGFALLAVKDRFWPE